VNEDESMKLLRYFRTLLLLTTFAASFTASAQGEDPLLLRQAIEQMKLAERGPFARLRWFCADGTVLPPTPYACQEHGGGHQHGEYNESTQRLRDNGYLIANILVTLSPQQALEQQANRLKWVLLERFLYETDNGWILREARYYRGAFQAESESAAALAIIQAMLSSESYQTHDFLLLREAARLLPWRYEPLALDRARALVTTIAENDPKFIHLRNKFHSFPEAADIQLVKEFLADTQTDEQRQLLDQLLTAMENTFRIPDLASGLRLLGGNPTAASAQPWHQLAHSWDQADTPERRLATAGHILVTLRESLTGFSRGQKQRALLLSLAAEQAAFAEGITLVSDSPGQDRRWYLQRLNDNMDVLYGIGFLTRREWQTQRDGIATVDEQLALSHYREVLDYLARVPAWTDNRFNFFLRQQLQKFALLEPRIKGFVPDRLRGSPLLLHGRLLQDLSIDANRLAGVHHEIFGKSVSMGVRSLNPGIARGPLQLLEDDAPGSSFVEKPVVLAAETIADLPPVAGILTAREGNTLSHIQLLARNLGIPNVVVGPELIAEIEQRAGSSVVLLSSPGGIVRLYEDGPEWDITFPQLTESRSSINIDTDKLDLDDTTLQSLAELRASDSGRIVGPKAAKLGELKAHFPEQVSSGLVLPFGLFRRHLQLTRIEDGSSLYDWMRQNYSRLERITNADTRQQETADFLAELRERIRNAELETGFRASLEERMDSVFGPAGSYGVFVRSDTNVEDLPGFTGAGLNLTVPNVTDPDQIIDAIKAVWASPFTERAYGWRQAWMDQPEHVYVSVLLHQTIASEKSGVMVTADITTNNPDTYTIAVNEGGGGGVDGQAAEQLTINTATGKVTLLSSAAEPLKRILPATGGVMSVPASGEESILSPDEITQLLQFGKSLPVRYPEIINAEGQTVPADIEFAFAGGQLNLIQIRPFLQSNQPRHNRILTELDLSLQDQDGQLVDLLQLPLQE
jgi:hypothetical protein